MKSEFTTKPLSALADIQTGPFGSQLHKEDYVQNGTPIVTVEHLGQKRFTEKNLPCVSEIDKERLNKYILREGDVVFSRVGSVDRCSYLNGMLTNEQVIEELLNLAKQMATANKEGEQLGLTADELAFYDALTKPQAIKDFYENTELIAITKELADTLRKNRTIDWQKRDSARAKMRMMIKRLLKRHRYPPEGMDDAVQTVMTQCELWTDNNDMESA